jgi:hypothetical protein
MVSNTAPASTQSWEPFAGCCTPAWLPRAGSRRQTAHMWDHWALKPYVDQGACQDGVAHMFWVSLGDNFKILIALNFDMGI